MMGEETKEQTHSPLNLIELNCSSPGIPCFQFKIFLPFSNREKRRKMKSEEELGRKKLQDSLNSYPLMLVNSCGPPLFSSAVTNRYDSICGTNPHNGVIMRNSQSVTFLFLLFFLLIHSPTTINHSSSSFLPLSSPHPFCHSSILFSTFHD